MTTCDKKEEYKTVRSICDTAVNGTWVDFPISWDTIGIITTVNFPGKNVSAKFGAVAHVDTLWMNYIRIPSFNYTGFNNIRYEKPNLTTKIPAVGCCITLAVYHPHTTSRPQKGLYNGGKLGESNITMQEPYIIQACHIILVIYYHTPNIKTGKCQIGQHKSQKQALCWQAQMTEIR